MDPDVPMPWSRLPDRRMKLESSRTSFDAYCETAFGYWRNNVLPPGDEVILVEALHTEFRVALRNLTVANAMRRFIPARLVLLTGTDRWWLEALWKSFDVALFRQLGEAFGAEIVDIHSLVDEEIRTGMPPNLRSVIRTAPPGLDAEVVPLPVAAIEANAKATFCRVLRVPRVETAVLADRDYLDVKRRTGVFGRLYPRLMAQLHPAAFVTSHVDYNQWGLAVDAARLAKVPVIHVQQNGGLKAYASFPEHDRRMGPIRTELTPQIAEVFENRIWSRRDQIRDSAELVAWRSKGNLGRPIWWRRGPSATIEIRNQTVRRQVRQLAMARLGLDPAKPVVAVFNHAVSDAIGANIETFDDLAAWFEQTARYGAGEPRVNWLLLDHPHQGIYDATGFVDRVSWRFRDARHVHFGNSLDLSKNQLWSLVDLGVTVRGSISNELPAYGIPVLQAGWSEWSGCGMTQVAGDQTTYWRLLEEDICALVDGRDIITEEQIERARLWLWFYRAATDVISPLLPHWLEGAGDETLRTLRIRMDQVEADGDPAFAATHRMWARRDPVLTRFDLDDDQAFAGAVRLQ